MNLLLLLEGKSNLSLLFLNFYFGYLFMDKEFIYITTSIAYVNAKPHIGFALESIQADVLARFWRQQGKKVYFLTGTDEHGTKIYQTAKEKGIETQKFVDENAERFKALREFLNLSYDDFIRTTDKERHWPSVQKMWQKLAENGDLKKDKYEGLYCVGCEAFLTEKDLVDGKCPNHNKAPERVAEENYFFNLGKYKKKIISKIESGELEILPLKRRNEILNILKEGYDKVSFSRPKDKLPWGVPVPGDDTQVMYVWCDALTNYISALGYADDSELFEKFWNQGYVTHLIGKDILRFHAAIWPAMLMAAGIKLPERIFVHGFITSEGKKMSKSIGNVVDPIEIVEKYGIDPVRYYLLKEIPAYGDGDFSLNRFEELYNADLANGIGNLFSRITNMVSQYLGGEIDRDEINGGYNWERIAEYTAACEFDKALAEIMIIVNEMNKYIDDNKPWQLAKSDREDDRILLKQVLTKVVLGLLELGNYLTPFLPETGEKITKHLSLGKITKAEPLFPRLEKNN